MATAPQGRLQSLDIFRGATIASMILVNNPGSRPAYPQLEHAVWHGWTFTDTVFPFFLWIVGVSLTLSTARRVERGEDRRGLLLHALRRAAIIFLLGFLLPPLPNLHLATIRIPGVLQRIAVCYLVATLIFLYTKIRGQIGWIIGLNALYLGLMMLYPSPGCGAGSISMECNFARYVDSLLFEGHMWAATKVWDPEGLVSTLPAISTVLLGILAGHVLRLYKEHKDRLRCFFAGGTALAAAGLAANIWLPINKNLWTTSFVLWMGGLAAVNFGFWYWLVDVKGCGRWLRPFQIYGMNAIVVYVLSGVWAKVLNLSGAHKWIYRNICLAVATPLNASVLYAVLFNVLALYLVAWLLWRKGWFVRF